MSFGRCPFFILFDENSNSTEIVKNPFANSLGVGAGVQLAQLLIEKNVDIVISTQMGIGPFRLLSSADVKIYRCAGCTAPQAVELLNENELLEMDIPSMSGGRKSRKRYGQGRNPD
jgi:predicted Fe-Mo cluster-binding NifX family protein